MQRAKRRSCASRPALSFLTFAHRALNTGPHRERRSVDVCAFRPMLGGRRPLHLGFRTAQVPAVETTSAGTDLSRPTAAPLGTYGGDVKTRPRTRGGSSMSPAPATSWRCRAAPMAALADVATDRRRLVGQPVPGHQDSQAGGCRSKWVRLRVHRVCRPRSCHLSQKPACALDPHRVRSFDRRVPDPSMSSCATPASETASASDGAEGDRMAIAELAAAYAELNGLLLEHRTSTVPDRLATPAASIIPTRPAASHCTGTGAGHSCDQRRHRDRSRRTQYGHRQGPCLQRCTTPKPSIPRRPC